ncbi:MAG: hypothetical protein LCI00_15770 [Chloroflexi bacterium]|nr:hypothetical protein [Chloroflexota bacterium]
MKSLNLALLIVAWIIFGLRLCRALWIGRFSEVLTRRIWSQVFLGMIAYTLFGPDIEPMVDDYFGGKPITLYVKSMAVLGMVYLYYLTLRDIDPNANRYGYLKPLGQNSAVIFTGCFGLYFLSPVVAEDDFRYFMLAFRELVISIFICMAILPNSKIFWRHEQVSSMKIRHAASILCSIGYLTTASGTIAIGILALLRHHEPLDGLIRAFMQPMYLVAIGFLIMLLPHRVFAWASYPAQLWIYWRIKRIERRIRKLANIENTYRAKHLVILNPQNLELAIYRSLIFVLDFHAFVPETIEGKTLSKQIQNVICSPKSYPELVNEIAALV